MAITFAGGFENGILYRDTGLANTWMHHQHSTGAEAYALQLVTDIVRRGIYALRVEVRSGDVYAGGERSEILYMTKFDSTHQIENESSGMKYYAISCYLPVDWIPPVSNYGLFLQLHAPDTYSEGATFSMRIGNRFFAYVCAGDGDTGFTRTECVFSNNKLSLGHWVDFIIKIKFSIDATGALQIWRHDDNENYFTSVYKNDAIPTLAYRSLHPDEPPNHYWKTGFYRGPTAYANVLYLDCHTRGDTFDEVVQSAYGGVPMATTIPLSGISSGNTPTTPVSITAVAANPALFSSIVVNYTDPNPTGNIVLTPVPDANGITNVTVTVDNHQVKNNLLTRIFNCNVKKINPPTLDPITDVSIDS